MSNPSKVPAPRRGCLFYAGILGAGLLLILLIGVAAGYYAVRNAIDTLTARTPARLPEVQVTGAEAQEIQHRVNGFREAVRARMPVPPLALTDHEINALIATNPEFSQLKGKIHVKIEDGQVRGQVSLPLEHIGPGLLKGRYLNGIGTFTLAVDGGQLQVRLLEVEVNGKPLPKRWMSRIRGINLAREANEDPEASTAIGTLQSLEVKDGRLVIVPKKPGG